jgi:TolB-like protein/Flp pilus assembly protein TadD
VAYAIVGWLLIEVASILLPTFQAPEWVMRVFSFFIIAGFPVALILSWAYELTPEGMKKTKSIPLSESITNVTGNKLNYVVTSLLALAVVFLLVEDYVFQNPDQEETIQAAVGVEPVIENPVAATEEEQSDVLPNSIAVLPFDNLSPDPDNDYFAAGIHEAVLNQLVKIQDLNVIARTSVLQYAGAQRPITEIARELNVGSVMEGSVSYAQGRVAVSAQLIDAETGVHLWSERYNRELVDVFGIQADIATNIANALQAEFSLAEQATIEKTPTESPEAYSLYLRGLGLGRSRSQLAVTLLEEAIEIDPRFALAHARLANWYHSGFSDSVTDRDERDSLATAYAQRALEIDPDLGYAYITLAEIHRQRLEGIEAQEDYEQAIALSPNDPQVLTEYALFKSETMQHVDAVRLARRGVELDPSNRSYSSRLARVYETSGDFEAATLAWTRNGNLRSARLNRVFADIINGDNAAAIEGLSDLEGTLAEFGPDLGVGLTRERNDVLLAEVAYAYSRLERREDAGRMVERIDQSLPFPVLAYLALGDRGATLERLNQLADEYSDGEELFNLKANPWNDPVLDEPEFVAVRERLGFIDL